MRRRGLVLAVAVAAGVLLAGRIFAFLYTEGAWYTALGARSLWTERLIDSLLLYATTFVAAAAFALVNFAAVRHSIISLVLPRRLGNVEFAEAVAPRRLDVAAAALALAVAIAGATVVPSWESLALVRTVPVFNEVDPYHQLDIGFYMAWLPFEMALQRWVWVVVLLTTVVVIALYALTPGLRWHDGSVRMTAYVRRHLAALITVILLMLAWRARVASYTLLFDGSGPDGTFSALDHRWLMPANVLLIIATIAGSALFLWASWSRQTGISFAALTGVLVLWLVVRQLIPLAGRSPESPEAVAADAPYAQTRNAFTRRAFTLPEDGSPPSQVERIGTDIARGAHVVRAASTAHIAPGARGYIVVSGDLGSAAPSLSRSPSRLAHAWEERDAGLLSRELPDRPAILRTRDLSERVHALAPVFMQGTRPAAMFRSDTLYWMLDLYTSSQTYPLSRRYVVAGERRGYFRHAATAYVQGTTGATMILLDRGADPLARAWQRRFPQIVRAPSAAPPWIEELALEPASPIPFAGEADSLFRARVRQLYIRMRAALSSSDLATFGEWFDSLGALLRRQESEETAEP